MIDRAVPLKDSSEAYWLDRLPDRVEPVTVAAYVPASLDQVVRILHPTADRRSWRDVASTLGTTVHSSVNWDKMSKRTGERDPMAPQEDSAPAHLLSRVLAHIPECGPIYQGVWDGLGTWKSEPSGVVSHGYRLFITTKDVITRWPDMDPSFPETASLLWSRKCRWLIWTPLGLNSTLVGGPRSLIDRLVGDAGLECFRVGPSDALGPEADTKNPSLPWLEGPSLDSE